jgi:dynein heavy chain 1
VWLGGLLNPEAYITATRQCVAQANSWSLEELYLEVTITDSNDQASVPHDCFAVTGIKLQGAQCRNNQLLLTSSIMMELPITLLRWIRVSGDEKVATSKLSLPIYLNSTRTELLYTVDLNIAPGQDPHSFYERGVALLTSTSLN